MKLKIEIDLDNDAFHDWNSTNWVEVDRILAQIRWAYMNPGEKTTLHDYNGNHVGYAKLTGCPRKHLAE